MAQGRCTGDKGRGKASPATAARREREGRIARSERVLDMEAEDEGAGKGEAWLRAELERLARALSDASRDKVQAAEYGLAVLEEQQALQQRYEDLERAGDALRRENDALKEVGVAWERYVWRERTHPRSDVIKSEQSVCLSVSGQITCSRSIAPSSSSSPHGRVCVCMRACVRACVCVCVCVCV